LLTSEEFVVLFVPLVPFVPFVPLVLLFAVVLELSTALVFLSVLVSSFLSLLVLLLPLELLVTPYSLLLFCTVESLVGGLVEF
jgi:hypothetical protein